MSKLSICTLAQTYDETKHNPVGMWMSEKLDGMRCVWTGTKLITRNNKVIHAPEYWTATLPKSKQLDGELFLGRGKFQQLISITRRLQPDDKAWLKVGYLVFDVIKTGKPWIDRFRVDAQHPVVPVPHFECKSTEQLTEFYNSIVDNGGEGVMLRDGSMDYVYTRSWQLLKVKPECEIISTVIGYNDGEGKYTGMLGSYQMTSMGKEYSVGSGLTDADRVEKFRLPIGTQCWIKYQCLTDSGVPRFPRFVGRV